MLLHTGLCKISAGQGGTGLGCLRHWMDAWLICSCPLLSCCCCWENETSPASTSVMPAPLPASARDSASLLVFPNEHVSAKGGKPCRARTPLIAPHCPFLFALCQLPARLCSLLQLTGQGRAGRCPPQASASPQGGPRFPCCGLPAWVGPTGGCPGGCWGAPERVEVVEVRSRTAAPGGQGGCPPAGCWCWAA